MSGAQQLVGLTVGDTAAAWRALGFDVVDDRFTVGGVTVDLADGTPHLGRTLDRLAGVGMHPRRTAEGLQGGDRSYAFLLLGTAVLEVIGPAEHDPGRTPAPAAFVGLAFTATCLDAVARLEASPASPGTRSSRAAGS